MRVSFKRFDHVDGLHYSPFRIILERRFLPWLTVILLVTRKATYSIRFAHKV